MYGAAVRRLRYVLLAEMHLGRIHFSDQIWQVFFIIYIYIIIIIILFVHKKQFNKNMTTDNTRTGPTS